METEIILMVLVFILAGTLAGIVTGLAGASAATVVTPMLVLFAGMPVYTAITVSLFSDVLASGISAITYNKNGNLKLDDGKYLAIASVIGSVFGSLFSKSVPDNYLGSLSAIFIISIGIKFIIKGIKLKKIYTQKKNNVDFIEGTEKTEENKVKQFKNKKLVIILIGLLLGLIAGFVGAGGGLMILMVLTAVLGYDTKTAVGTSVFIMTFTALSGGLSHLPYLEITTIFVAGVILTSIFAVIGAKFAAQLANKIEEYILISIVGATFTVLASIMIVNKLFM